MHPYVYCCIIYSSQDMEALQVSINWWMDEEDVVYICKEYYSAIKKNEILSFATRMDVEGIMLSEISQK